MKTTHPELPKNVTEKLRAIRRRLIAFTLFEGLFLTAAALLGAMLLAMLIDWAVGWFSPVARFTFTLLALGAAAAALVLWCLRPLARKRTIVSTAREVDFWMPQLEERWSTATELAQNQDAPEVRGSALMIKKVIEEAEAAEATVSPAILVSPKPVFKAARWLAGAAALVVLFFLVNLTQASLLFQRFWMPAKNISLTQIQASPVDLWVPKGEALTLHATLQGRIPNEPPQLFIRTDNGGKKTVMTAKTGVPDSYQYSIDELTDSFEYRVRSGDGQTPWHSVTAVERPKITEVKLKITPPNYSNLAEEEKDALPHAVRVLDGSEIEVGFRADQPLDRMVLEFGNGESTRLSKNGDDWFQFRIRPTNYFSFAAAAINKFELENKTKPSCRFTVYEDLAPTVTVLEPSNDFAVAPGAKVNVTFEATDDLGLAKAEIMIATLKADGTTNQITLPVPLGADQGERQSRQTVELDPQALGLEHGDQLSYVVQVTDTKQTLTQAGGDPRESAAQTAAASPNQSEQNATDSPQPEPNDTTETEPNSEVADATSTQSGQPQNQDETEPRVNTSSQPPPNEMAMRALDAGQSSACEPRNIKVDKWAGQFDGERREKLEIAIEPILQRLDELLSLAQQKTDTLKAPADSEDGLQANHSEPLETAGQRLVDAEETVVELNSLTSGTPYAFIGLQLQNISQAHVTPAHQRLKQVVIAAPPPTNNVALIDKASFHIARAREMLADLTKTYQQVKRDQKVADAMQRLSKMYQIFLEDTQALLGNKPGPLNSYDRKIAEVDEQYVEKLRELLEEKKKIMAELADLLSEDPRLLRRYLAMLEQQSVSYRDQMTLLAQRQEQIQKQIAQWEVAPAEERSTLVEQFRESYRPQQNQIAQDATKLRENMETWLPLDVHPDQVESTLAQGEKVVQLLAKGVEDIFAQELALIELRELRESLPELDQIQSTNNNRMSAYIANRMVEVEHLITAQSGQMKIAESFIEGDFPKVAEVTQHRITSETVTLSEKLDATEQQVASMSAEIAEKAEQLTQIVETDIVPAQETSIGHLAAREITPASELLTRVVPAFALAEQTFDELIQLMIAKLDEEPPPTDPGGAQDMESLLTMLEDEMKASEGLGIPCRPINVSISRDWMSPSSNGNQGMGQAQAQAAQAQAQHSHAESERLEKEARRSAQRALAQAREEASPPNPATAVVQQRGDDWNKLVSKLQKDLLQGRDNTPPEQYREAIDNYFRVISDPSTTLNK